MSSQRFSYFLQLTFFTVSSILLGIVLFTVMRGIMLLHYSSQDLWQHLAADVRHCYFIGLLFDIKTLTILFAPFYLFGLLLTLAPYRYGMRYYLKVLRYVSLIILLFCLVIALVNFYYYDAFQAHFNLFFFGVTDGETNSILASVWQEYPVIKVLLVLLVVVGFLFYFSRKLLVLAQRCSWSPRWLVKTSFIIAVIFIYFLGARGSLGVFPLQNKQTYFSTSNLLNQASLNGVAALAYAYKAKKNDVEVLDVTNQQGVQAYNTYYKKHLTAKQFSLNHLFTHTKHNAFLVKNPPNVIFVQMESMGVHILLSQSKQNNVLGRLAPNAKKDLFFTHFVSGGNGTEPSLEHFILNSPVTGVFQSSMQKVSFASSVAKPFKEAGYMTVFLQSGHVGWRNLDNFLPKQDFDKVLGANAIKDKFTHAETETWGVYDFYTFEYALYLLKQAEKIHKPIFIYMNTVSNHPPYTIPKSYHPAPIKVPKQIQKILHMSEHNAKMVLSTYQYASDSLGWFIHQVKASALAKDTIIGASGDHNQHELMSHYTNPHMNALQRSVPFYLYIPQAYSKGIVKDDERIGSHKDIFPTLYNLALSDVEYLNMGDNLVAKHRRGLIFGYNPQLILLEDGVIKGHGSEARLYPFANAKRYWVKSGQALNAEQALVLKRVAAYEDLLDWQIQRQGYDGLHHKRIK